MFSTVCLDTSCYSTWNYFSQGSCHITHKVPIEEQHHSDSTKPVQCTHKEGIIFILLPCQNHIFFGTTGGKQFSGGLGFFFFFDCSFGTVSAYPMGQDTALGNFSRSSSRVSVCSCTALSILTLPAWILPLPVTSRYKPKDGNSDPDHIRHAEDKQFLLQAMPGLLSGRCLKMGLNKELS